MKTVKDIYSIPCATYGGGRKKAISIVEKGMSKVAYVQFCDGMQVWKHNPDRNRCELIREEHCINY